MEIESFYQEKLLECGFIPQVQDHSFCSIGKLFKMPEEIGAGLYWIYGQKNLFDIKIHDFYYYEDSLFNLEILNWPECLSISYYESVSGEELMPYRRITAGCVKTFFGGTSFKAVFHKNIPIRSIGIEILPAYYESYLKETYPHEYLDPSEAFRKIDQTKDFPEMIHLLQHVWRYRGAGIAAKLFYEAKVAEMVSLVVEYNRTQLQDASVKISPQDLELIQNTALYINDYFNRDITISHLSRIACMGTTKFKLLFKNVYQCTVSEYIQQRRLSHAENLLSSTDFTIEQIARTVGYSNPGRFAGLFHKSTGLLPSEYKKLITNQ